MRSILPTTLYAARESRHIQKSANKNLIDASLRCGEGGGSGATSLGALINANQILWGVQPVSDVRAWA